MLLRLYLRSKDVRVGYLSLKGSKVMNHGRNGDLIGQPDFYLSVSIATASA
jgi:hypothetical protein